MEHAGQTDFLLFCAELGYTRDELLHMTWAEITHPEDLGLDLEQFERLLRGEIDCYDLDKRFIHKNGHVIFTRLAVSVVRKSDGSVDYLVALVEDITERKLLELELKRQTHVDYLTGISN